MTNELEPCAYCGGETYLTHGKAVYSNLPMFKCNDCGAVTSFDAPIPNAAMMVGDDTPAIEMFNTRYKRTCHVIIEDELQVCSECEEVIDPSWAACPYCGAEVVDG